MPVQSRSSEMKNATSRPADPDAELKNSLLAAMRLWDAEAKEIEEIKMMWAGA